MQSQALHNPDISANRPLRASLPFEHHLPVPWMEPLRKNAIQLTEQCMRHITVGRTKDGPVDHASERVPGFPAIRRGATWSSRQRMATHLPIWILFAGLNTMMKI